THNGKGETGMVEGARLAGRSVQSIEVGAKLLQALTDAGEPLMLKNLAARAGMKPSQAHPYLLSFRRVGLVEQNPDTGHYLLGPFALHMGLMRARNIAPLRIAQQAATKLSLDTGLITAISVWGSHGPTVLFT